MSVDDANRPEPDRTEPAPHPRDCYALYGHQDAESRFLDALSSGRLHHGWLLTGPQGVGKATLAWRIARHLLANPKDDGGLFGAPEPATSLALPADHPVSRATAQLSAPGLFLCRRPYDDKTNRLRTAITVDEIRRLKAFFGLSATDGGWRVAIIDAMDELNIPAQNALLKILEEPPAQTVFLMVCHQPGKLLPTIRSRVRELRLGPLAEADLEQALSDAGLFLEPGDIPPLMQLSHGSAGEAVRLLAQDGASIYAELISLMAHAPGIDRQAAMALSDSCAGRGAEARYDLILHLLDLMMARFARAGAMHMPPPDAAMGESALIARIAPHDRAARLWASCAQEIAAQVAHARGVNLDPAQVVMNILLKIDSTAGRCLTS